MKIVQIASCGVNNTSSTQCNWLLFALREDGTLWALTDMHDWMPVNPISDSKQQRNDSLNALIEQHGHYELGDGFTLSKTSKLGWCLYWRSKHVDIWKAKIEGKPEPLDMELTSYRSAVEAYEARQAMEPFA